MPAAPSRRVCGVDEAGRGPIAGPVYAAAVVLEPGRRIPGIADSKALEPGRREELALVIRERALAWAVAWASVEEIDRINILQAALLAMRRAVEALAFVPDEAWIDGDRCPELACAARPVVGGDARVRPISAASILAKTERDLQVAFLSRRSPELNRVMTIYTAVLGDFLQKHLLPRLEQMGKVTIRVCKSARRPNSVGYKVLADAFGDFRAEWERLFMQQMVFFCGDELLERLTQSSEEFQEETVKFFTDPHVFSETCAVVCEQLYDFLCLEGFLDLPVDWRVSLNAEG